MQHVSTCFGACVGTYCHVQYTSLSKAIAPLGRLVPVLHYGTLLPIRIGPDTTSDPGRGSVAALGPPARHWLAEIIHSPGLPGTSTFGTAKSTTPQRVVFWQVW
ncbi:hypothetical protein VDGL01_01807 [Verticillium dahliae]